MNNNIYPVAQEGWKYIAYAFVAFVVLNLLDLDFLSFFAFLAILFLAFVYRNPERVVPFFEQNSVVSPVDGVIKNIVELENDEYKYKIEIENRCFDISLLRIPVDGTSLSAVLTKGARVSSNSKLFNDLNENLEIVFLDKNSNEVKVNHKSTQSFAPIVLNDLSRISKGYRYGVMIHGITTIYLKENFRINLKVGDTISSSQTLIGYYS